MNNCKKIKSFATETITHTGLRGGRMRATTKTVAPALLLRLSARSASSSASSSAPLFIPASEYLKVKDKVVTLDTRSPQDFEAGRIPGARNAHDVFTYLLPSSSPQDVAAMLATFSKAFGS